MSRIYRLTDRIPIRIDDVTVTIRPLNQVEKSEILQNTINGQRKMDVRMMQRAAELAMKYAITNIKGLNDSDGKDYSLTLDGNNLSDDCVDELLNLPIKDKLAMVCQALVHAIPDKFVDKDGKPIEGVEFVTKTEKKKLEDQLQVDIHPFWKGIVDVIMHVSSLNSSDHVKLVANYYNVFCSEKSKQKIDESKYNPEAIRLMNQERNKRFIPIEYCSIRFSKPFDDIVYDNFDIAIIVLDNYKKGILPFQGGILDQPAQVVEILSVMLYMDQQREYEQAVKSMKKGRKRG